MRYFSIDYRSPPSGMGQIIDTTKPEMIGDRYNYILITYSGCGSENDPSYNLTKHFSSQEAEKMYQIKWPKTAKFKINKTQKRERYEKFIEFKLSV